MRFVTVAVATAALAWLGTAQAAPTSVQVGLSAPDAALVPAKTSKKSAKAKKRMRDMKGMDHGKMPM